MGNGKDWDYKQQNKDYADFGNWHYGVIAKAIGILESLALSGAGAAQAVSQVGGEKYGSFYGIYVILLLANLFLQCFTY